MLRKDIFNYRPVRFLFFIVMFFLCFALATGCSFRKPYVGRSVDSSSWPQYFSGKKFIFNTSVAVFEFTINETEVNGEYFLEGTMDGSRGSLKSINNLVTKDCRFYLLLAKDNVIVDSVSFSPLGADHTHKLPFSKRFKADPFDSVNITGKVAARG